VKNNRRLWIFDIEATLTGPRGRGMQASVVTGLFFALRSGSLVGVNTNRETRFARAVHQLFDMNGPVIAEGGCGWWQPSMGELSRGVCLHRLTDEERQRLRSAVVKAGLNDTVWEDWRKEYVSTWYPYAFNRKQKTDVTTVKKVLAEVIKAEDEMEMAEGFEAVSVVPRGVDKGTGLHEVCNELAMPLSAVGYVGESWADWPALAAVLVAGGRGVMMGKDEQLRQQVLHMGGEVLDEGSYGLVKWLTQEFSE
jgi:hydroxymethylpyrimidine pyrophosphatase-like HAD family hydrolase